ncbi:hypothetical protein VT47_10670 [Pseudomonas syringae pv. syringae]|nr:hypothetical protein C5I_0108385 [Pseudomonas syringae pv. syringae FF5]KZL39623.1 hypothetical protein VT47_10670 [Pseudomonas syringae pv. syringae]
MKRSRVWGLRLLTILNISLFRGKVQFQLGDILLLIGKVGAGSVGLESRYKTFWLAQKEESGLVSIEMTGKLMIRQRLIIYGVARLGSTPSGRVV